MASASENRLLLGESRRHKAQQPTYTYIEGPGFARLIICDLASVVCALPLGTAPAGSFGVQGTHTGMLHRRAPEHGHDLPT